MPRGGVRPGSGRPKGAKGKLTLEKDATLKAFQERVCGAADELFNAQYALAIGARCVFRIDEEEGENGRKKRVHTLVTDPDEIKALLDGHQGEPGTVEGRYYYFVTERPDNKAAANLLDRGFGRPKESIEIERTITFVREGFERMLEVLPDVEREELAVLFCEWFPSVNLTDLTEGPTDQDVRLIG